jgi:predicted Zn-ribbon and HTH transcriptional regulator
VPDQPTQSQYASHGHIITGASTRDDVAQILYGLNLRGVRAHSIEADEKQPPTDIPGRKPDRFLIVLDAPNELQQRIANESIDAIWDAILEQHPRAVTPSGHCSFCGYDIARLPRPTTCPECGVNVDSIEARRVMRTRRL